MFRSQSVFNFEDPVAFLNAEFRERQNKDPRFSLRGWARQMGYRNPSLLFQVLKGERRLKIDLALKCAATLNLKGKSLRYFELLVLTHGCDSETERRMFKAMIAKLRPRQQRLADTVSLDVFALSSDWYHWAIWTLAEIPGFSTNPAWIQSRLGPELDKKTIKEALDRLFRLELLRKDSNGEILRGEPHGNHLLASYQVPSEAVRNYHTQMISHARAAVEQQTFEERQLRGLTMSFNKKDLPKVEAILAEAYEKVLALSSGADAEDVYQLNSQFFRLTKKKVERTH